MALSRCDRQADLPFPVEDSRTWIVTRTFDVRMADELLLMPGELLKARFRVFVAHLSLKETQIEKSYDDGWCLGFKWTPDGVSAPRGVFPRQCVEQLPLIEVPFYRLRARL